MKNKKIITESERKQIIDNKQKLIIESFASTFNKIKRIDEDKIDEIGPNLASKTLGYNHDPRKAQLQKDAITSMFSQFIGKDKPFFIKISEDTNPIKYQLIEVELTNRLEFVNFHFYNEAGVDDDAPYADNKKEIIIKYDIKEDKIDMPYFLNRFSVNFFVTAANLIRKAYFTQFPETVNTGKEFIPDPNFDFKSRVTKDNFRMFNYDSKSITNVNEIQTPITKIK
jgi:hypothetical protein